jgi:ATPase subunit of ABC transporter with duplicated ATPase domains
MSLKTATTQPVEIDEQARDRAEGAYDHYSMQRAETRRRAAELPGLSADKQAALDAAMAQIDRAFGTFDRATGRRLPKVAPMAKAA